jgi:hypothetical protein
MLPIREAAVLSDTLTDERRLSHDRLCSLAQSPLLSCRV